jgi:hypothetical protein
MRVCLRDCRRNHRAVSRGACDNARRVSQVEQRNEGDSVIGEGITFAVWQSAMVAPAEGGAARSDYWAVLTERLRTDINGRT